MGKRRRESYERFIWLRFWLFDSPAWRSLPCNAQALYLRLARQYNGRNNGRISYSLRRASQDLNIGKTAAVRAFQALQNHGFIVCTKKGAFSWKTVKDASEWRLTEYQNNFPPEYPSKEFMRWRPPEPDSNEAPKSRTRVLKRDHKGPETRPNGSSGETMSLKKGPHGSSGETVNVEKDPSTGPKTRHIQLPGTAGGLEGGERSAPIERAVASEPPDWRQRLKARQRAENEIANLIGWSCLQEIPPELVEGLCSRWLSGDVDTAELYQLKEKYDPRARVAGAA